MSNEKRTTKNNKESIIKKEWHKVRNGDLNSGQFSSGSAKKVWWQCDKGHEWQAQIRSRNMGVGCPVCKGRLPSSERNLEVLYPNIAREWIKTKNKPLTPRDVTPGSARQVWWKCKKGHEWKAIISSRSKGSGCPYCYGNKVGEDNNLAVKFPEVAKEWHPTKNNTITPKQLTAASNKKVWWECDNGHEWEARVASRTINRSGCPECSGKKSGKDNNLKIMFPVIAKEWHPTKNINLNPDDVAPGSTKKVWWKCPKGHEWETSIRFRIQRKTGCPICSGRKAGTDNNLLVIFPEIAKEWHPTKNEPLTPKDVTYGSGKKVWWKCSKGHIWETPIVSRSKGNICPLCKRTKRK